MALTDRQWRRLIRAIRDGRCVLMLGPRLAAKMVGQRRRPLIELLAEYLSEELVEENIPFEEEGKSHLPYIAQRYLSEDSDSILLPSDLQSDVLDFYARETQEMPSVYQQLAQLPFPVIINTTPDRMMVNAINALPREGQKKALPLYYNFKRTIITEADNRQFQTISVDQPLVYNLFGDVSDQESLVLTEDDQVAFIRRVVQNNPPIPSQVIDLVTGEGKTYLFLGFNLEHWHFRLLLESLNLTNKNRIFSPHLPDYPVGPITKYFYANRYKFTFVDSAIEAFVGELTRQYNQVIRGRRNGNQAIAEALKTEKDQFSIINVEADQPYANRLSMHLKSTFKGMFSVWNSGLIPAGSDYSIELKKGVEEGSVILLLFSTDFLADDRVEQHLWPLISGAKEAEKLIIPVITRPCNWETEEWKDRVVLPRNGKPIFIGSEKASDRDDLLTAMVKEISKLVE